MLKKWFSVVIIALALVTAGITQLPTKTYAQGEGECWAVIVGISNSQYQKSLPHSDNDARELSQLLSPIWGQGHIKLLLDSGATKANILAAIDWLAEKDEAGDTVLFYFSGHGSSDGYIAPYEGRSDTTCISRNELDSRLDKLSSSRVVIILDTCHAGVWQGSLSANGRVLLMSCRPDEYSLQTDGLGHYVFTNYILQAFDEFTDTNQDYELSAEEIFQYAGPKATSYLDELHAPYLNGLHIQYYTQHPVISDGYPGELGLLEKFVFSTKTTLPSGTQILVLDGQAYSSAPPPSTWAPGSIHSLEVPSLVNEGTDTKYIFASWNDGNTSPSRTISGGGVYAPSYTAEYLMTITSLYNEPGGEGWYKAGETANISVKPTEGIIIRHVFTGWSGSINETTPDTTILMNGPKTITANWRTDYTQLYILIAGLMALAAIAIIILRMRRRRAVSPVAEMEFAIPVEEEAPVIPPEKVEPIVAAPPIARAKLMLPDSSEISLTEAVRPIGRGDFEKTTSPETLKYISRQHLLISYDNGKYFVEDLNSTNGTKINGVEIKDRGRWQLRDGDRIDIAGVVTLTFKTYNLP